MTRKADERPLIFRWYDETGHTQKSACEALGVTHPTLRKYEWGEPIPKKVLILMEAVRRGIGPYTGIGWARRYKARLREERATPR